MNNRNAYPSDLTDKEGEILELLPPCTITFSGQCGIDKAGDKIAILARHYADRANVTEFVVALREGRLSIEKYRNFIITMYPLVVGFNGGLIRSISKLDELQGSAQARELVEEMFKVDHVRQSSQVQTLAIRLRAIAREEKLPGLRALAGQLKEEQEHNDYYRQMLEIHGIDHESYYTAFEEYMSKIPIPERDRMTQEVIVALSENQIPDVFPQTCFSQAVLALCHYLMGVANDPKVGFFTYYALQSAIEFILVKLISEAVFPGVVGTRDCPRLNLALVPDAEGLAVDTVPPSIRWWDEHADYGKGGRIELQHVRHGQEQLNRNLLEESNVEDTLQRVDSVLLLFSALPLLLEY